MHNILARRVTDSNCLRLHRKSVLIALPFSLLLFSAGLAGTAQASELSALQIPSLSSLQESVLSSPISFELTNVGNVTNQADFSPAGTPGGTRAAAARAAFGVNGAGIKIGIISDSYNKLGGAAAGVTSGDLPAGVVVVKDDLGATRTDEGRGMAEIVHDLAPGAQILFHSAFNNTVGPTPGQTIADAIDALRVAGANIIVDDVFQLNSPWMQDGPAAKAVNVAKAAGIAYFSSAGNSSRNSYEGAFNGGVGGFQNYDANANEGGDTLLNINVPNGGSVRVTVQWDDAFPSVGGAPPNPANYDIGLWDFTAGAYVSTSLRNQGTGLDPWELVGSPTNNTGVAKQYGLAIQHIGGSTARGLKALISDAGSVADDDDTLSPTVVGQNAATGALAIAAMRYDSASTVEGFSSRGPTTIRFDGAGVRLAVPEIRNTPQLTATDGGDTTFFGGGDYEPNGFPNFFGTSAAAPTAAAVGALILQRAANLGVPMTVDSLYNLLKITARDIEGPGFDINSGFGMIDAYLAVQSVPEPSSLALLGGCAVLFFSRRRRPNRMVAG